MSSPTPDDAANTIFDTICADPEMKDAVGFVMACRRVAAENPDMEIDQASARALLEIAGGLVCELGRAWYQNKSLSQALESATEQLVDQEAAEKRPARAQPVERTAKRRRVRFDLPKVVIDLAEPESNAINLDE